MCRKLNEQERKVKGGEEKGVMIEEDTRIAIEINTEGFASYFSFQLNSIFFIF